MVTEHAADLAAVKSYDDRIRASYGRRAFSVGATRRAYGALASYYMFYFTIFKTLKLLKMTDSMENAREP